MGALEEQPADQRLRVLHLGPDVAVGGGMPAVIRDLMGSPLAERHRFYFIATWRGRKPFSRVVVFARAAGGLVRWCASPGTRLVHVHTAMRGSLYRKGVCVALARAMRRPVVLHLHVGAAEIAGFHSRLDPVRRWFGGKVFALADRVISVSEAGARETERCFGFGDIAVVPNPAPVVREIGPADNSGRPPGLLYLGGFEYAAKGGSVLARALGPMLEQTPDLTVELAGPGAPPAEVEQLAAVSPRIKWLGWLNDADKLGAFSRCAIFVLPSVSEGLPVALLEAMSHGRAIVATRVGGVPATLTDDVDALLVQPGDPDALREAVLRLAGDSSLRRRLGASAAVQAQTLSHERILPRFDELYAGLAGR